MGRAPVLAFCPTAPSPSGDDAEQSQRAECLQYWAGPGAVWFLPCGGSSSPWLSLTSFGTI